MNSNEPEIIYEHQHNVSLMYDNASPTMQAVFIKVMKTIGNKLVIKLQQIDDYNFNYTTEIDHSQFSLIKKEQQLEVQFEEFGMQMIEMFKDTHKQKMYLRLEANDLCCKLIFFEKSCLKSLISLILDLRATNKCEIIAEIDKHLHKVKNHNTSLQFQVRDLKNEIEATRNGFVKMKSMKDEQELHFRQQIATISRSFATSFDETEEKIRERMNGLDRRHMKLQRDVQTLKNETQLKNESNVRLANSVKSLRLENERRLKINDDFQLEINHLRLLNNNTDAENENLRKKIQTKQNDVEEQLQNITALKKDLQEATLIIAQKSEAHDEIAKDLVQANSIIVNINNQYDNLFSELDGMKNALEKKNRMVTELETRKRSVEEKFEAYRTAYGPEKLQLLQKELVSTKKLHDELEVEHKTVVKLNTLLTQKLTSVEESLGGLRF